MGYENLKLRKRNFTVDGGYFYSFDEDSDMLLQKTDDGTTAFSYPLDTVLNETITSTEYDGVNFWTLADGVTDSLIIRRWKIDNYICKLQTTFNLNAGSGHKYDSEAFSVEHYHASISGTAVSGTTNIYIKDGYESKLFSGMAVTLGPNSFGYSETINVFNTGIGYVTLEDPTEYTYADDDSIQFYNYIWLFNNYNGEDSSTGALYKFNAYTGSYITKYIGGAYKDIKAATFYKVDSFTAYGYIDTLCYIKATNMLFIDVTGGATLSYYGSMAMDNIEDNEFTIIEVYDLAMCDQNVYRLQLKATYYGSTTSWSVYNYQLASLNSFVTSISLSAYPGIIAANQVSSSDIVATVKDQFNQPVVARLVYFTDDDNYGSITGGTPINTNSEGEAATIYKSGNQAREVKITATVEQV